MELESQMLNGSWDLLLGGGEVLLSRDMNFFLPRAFSLRAVIYHLCLDCLPTKINAILTQLNGSSLSTSGVPREQTASGLVGGNCLSPWELNTKVLHYCGS